MIKFSTKLKQVYMQRKYTQLRCVVVHVQLLMRILARPSESTYAYDPHTYIYKHGSFYWEGSRDLN